MSQWPCHWLSGPATVALSPSQCPCHSHNCPVIVPVALSSSHLAMSQSKWPLHSPNGHVNVPVTGSQSQSQERCHLPTSPKDMSQSQLPCSSHCGPFTVQSKWSRHRPRCPVIVTVALSQSKWLRHLPTGPVTVTMGISMSQWPCHCRVGPVTLPVILSPTQWPFYCHNCPVIVPAANSPRGNITVEVTMSQSYLPYHSHSVHRPNSHVRVSRFIQSQWHFHRQSCPVTVPVGHVIPKWPCCRPSGHVTVQVSLSQSQSPCHSPCGDISVSVALSKY